MKCNFCEKEIDIKKEWLKKPLFKKMKDVVNYYRFFDFSLSGENDKIGVGVTKAIVQAFYFVVSSLLLFASGFSITFSLFNLMDKYVFLKPLFNPAVPVITFSNTILPIFGGIILLIPFFYITYLMFKSDLRKNFEKIFNRNVTSLKCPFCEKNNKLKILYLGDSAITDDSKKIPEKISKKDQRKNVILGILIITIAVIAFIIYISIGDNLHKVLNPEILWIVAIVFAGVPVIILIQKLFPNE